MADEILLTVGEAAERCGCSPDTIRRRLKSGRLPHARRAGPNDWDVWTIPESDLRAVGLLRDDGPVVEQADRSSLALELADAQQALRAAEVRIQSLEVLADDRDADISHLRAMNERLMSLITEMTGRAA